MSPDLCDRILNQWKGKYRKVPQRRKEPQQKDQKRSEDAMTKA